MSQIKRGNRWTQEEILSDVNLLTKKDEQIAKLKIQLERERRRADTAMEMLNCYKDSRTSINLNTNTYSHNSASSEGGS